jgi:hypothetical protein
MIGQFHARQFTFVRETPSRLHGSQSLSGRREEEKGLCSSGNLILISASSLLLNNAISDIFECSMVETQNDVNKIVTLVRQSA